MLANDSRRCAKEINNMSEAYYNERRTMEVNGEVEFYQNGYLFGHYDSRGGGSLVIAPNIINAIESYNHAMFCNEGNVDMIVEEDFIKTRGS
jgi:hypothetical protein